MLCVCGARKKETYLIVVVGFVVGLLGAVRRGGCGLSVSWAVPGRPRVVTPTQWGGRAASYVMVVGGIDGARRGPHHDFRQ